MDEIHIILQYLLNNFTQRLLGDSKLKKKVTESCKAQFDTSQFLSSFFSVTCFYFEIFIILCAYGSRQIKGDDG